MKYSYYPGCTLKTKAKELNDYAIASAKALGIEMEEIEDWQCCGGYLTLNDKELAQKRSNAVVASALEQQADCMITACPLCRYNLVANATENQIPVYYFTELLAEALGVKEEVQA